MLNSLGVLGSTAAFLTQIHWNHGGMTRGLSLPNSESLTPLNPHRSNTIGQALRWPGSAIAATPPLAVRFEDVEFLLVYQHETFP